MRDMWSATACCSFSCFVSSRDALTEFGVVRGYQHGPDGGVPRVLLHCFWATSAMWAEHIPALAGEFTVYTVDMLGQPGASVQTKSMVTADHCARCMNEVFGELGLAGVHLVGHSYGGWTATQTAARKSGRLTSVTLIEPCNTVARLSGKFWRSGALLLLPGAERKQNTVGDLVGRPAPGSTLDSVMQLVMAAGSAFASFGTRFPRYTPILCRNLSTCQSRSCWRETQFTTLRRESTGCVALSRRGVIDCGRRHHTCCRVRPSMKSPTAYVISRSKTPRAARCRPPLWRGRPRPI